MQLTFLGTGTSHGVPVIACDCKVCKSRDSHDKRMRCSAYVVSASGKAILIDIGPEFRIQALQNNIRKVDAVLLTHSHADHLHGLDDLRIFSCDMADKPTTDAARAKVNAPAIPVYTNQRTLKDVENRFDYIFKPAKIGGGKAKLQLLCAESQFALEDVQIIPIPMLHGRTETVGWLLSEIDSAGNKSSIVYLTDCNYISPESIQLIKDNCGELKHLIIDGLRIEAHSTHFNILQAMEVACKIGGENVWITHLTHHSTHEEYQEYINNHLRDFSGLTKKVSPAYDGLTIHN